MHCKYLPVVPYKALENFSKALYGTTGRYLQCMHYPSCHERLSAILAKSGPLNFPSEKSFLLFFAREKGLGHMFQK